MRKVTLLVCLLSWVSLAAGEPVGKPIIKVDQAEHDFGLIWSGPSQQHSFKITNTGMAELKIAKVRPNCGCTVAGDYPKSLAPGASGTFPFSLSTTGIKGPFNKGITISSNDPAAPELKLALKGEGRPLVAIEPAGAYFGSVYGSQPRTRVLAIENNGGTPLKLAIDPMSSKGPFKCELAEKVPGRSFELTVTFDPAGQKTGLIENRLALMTNNETMRQVQVNAVATIKDRVEVEPNTLSVMAPTSRPAAGQKAGSPITRTLRLRNYGEQPVKAMEVAADDPAVQVKLKEETAGRLYSIEVTTPASYIPPANGRTITVKTDDPEKSAIKVPVQKGRSGGRGLEGTAQRRPNPVEEKIGKEAPAFSLTTLSGKKVSEKDLKGAVTVLDFYSPNCGFCKKQLPRVEAIRQEYEAKGVRFLCVTQTMGKLCNGASHLIRRELCR